MLFPGPTRHSERVLETKRITTLALVVLVSFAAAFISTDSGALRRVDDWCQDVYHVIAGKRHDATHSVIASLDDATLAVHPDTPLVFWGPIYAKALTRLRAAGARAVALDIHLGITPTQWLQTLGIASLAAVDLLDYDQDFDLSLSEGNVVLAANLVRVGAEIKVRLPAAEYMNALSGGAASTGLTTLNRDPDNRVRKFVLDYELLDALPAPRRWPTFAAAAVLEALGEEAATPWHDLARERPMPISFCGPPGTIPRVSLSSVLREGGLTPQEEALVKGRIVFVGVEFEGASDRLPTPYSPSFAGFGHRDMSNVEIHANIAETLLNPGRVRAAPLWFAGLVWLPFLAASAFACDRYSPLMGNGVKLFVILAGWATGLLFFLGGVLLPVAGLALGQSCVYIGIGGLRMTRTERARARMKAIFGKYVSARALEQILLSGEAPELGGARHPVTVLFSDIRDFTVLSERLTPEDVVSLLNAYLPDVCGVVEKNGGMVNKFIGDAVMCVFCQPLGCTGHARQAVLTALELQDLAARFRQDASRRFPGLGPDSFRIGVGLHTGEALLGNIGSPERMEFTVIGDTVNTASRLEGLSKDLGWAIVASEEAFLAAGPGVLAGRRAVRHVKGKKEDVAVVEIVGIEKHQEAA